MGPGRCFAAATDYAQTTGATYVEGFVLVPGPAQWPVCAHAWCLRDGAVADPSLPDGHAARYGIPLAADYGRREQARRGTHAVLTDPDEPWAVVNEEALRDGLPAEAVLSGATRDRTAAAVQGVQRCPSSPSRVGRVCRGAA
ncbi:hypothetical protein [Kitasatospora sp. NPDC085879]|uniref:hypothetical protein n=1 Tax=Kitasatospora sp. NPDC085879 TaxID=3154769 RepID=UPI00342A12A0